MILTGNEVAMKMISARVLLGALIIVALGCGSSGSSPDKDAAPDSVEPVDSATPADTELPPDTIDTSQPELPPVEEVVDPACEARCAPFAACDAAVVEACNASCVATEVGDCEGACLAVETTCEAAEACLGLPKAPAIALAEGPYGQNNRDLAGPFELPTHEGTFSLADHWNGQNTFMFVMTRTGFEYAEKLWKSEPLYWLKDSPKNVHYIIMSYEPQSGPDDSEQNVMAIKANIDVALEKIGKFWGKAGECHWRRRIHYVPQSAWTVGGWIEEKLKAKGVLAFAIDRFQRIRAVGLLSLVGGDPLLYHLLYEPRYYNFEWKREQNLVKEGVTTVTLYSKENTKGDTRFVDLPPPEVMAGFDTLEIDLVSNCNEHLDSNCGEWDTGAHLDVREYPVEEINADAQTPCKPKTDDVPADTLTCECVVPTGGTRDGEKVCKDDGSGFKDCDCNGSIELVRWITTYSREGRWISDHSAMLAALQGGKTRFSYSAGNTYVTDLTFRLFKKGKGERAHSIHKLFGGGPFNVDYSSKYEPLQIDVPADAKRVEVLAYITGHGFGSDKANCAEFCNHTHHFFVNGTENMHDQPYVGKQYGCAMQVEMGAVPNQFGTWTLGRGGWCPGMDVKPYVVDVTDQITLGGTNTITYKGLFEGKDYVTEPLPENRKNGFGGSIWMNSWLVVYK
jgi:hypothetical protein